MRFGSAKRDEERCAAYLPSIAHDENGDYSFTPLSERARRHVLESELGAVVPAVQK
jgi:hypothetical protein